MAKFSEDSKCPKCGSEFIGAVHVADPHGHGECIRRKCSRCGYAWTEETLDSPVKDTP